MFWSAPLAARIIGGAIEAMALVVRAGGRVAVEIYPNGVVLVRSARPDKPDDVDPEQAIIDCTKDGLPKAR